VRSTEDSTFVLLLIAVSLAFTWILWPFYGAILWAIVFATLFAPAHRRLLSSVGKRANLAALITVLLIVTIVLLPLTLTAMSVVQEATSLYGRIEKGEVDFGRFLSQLLEVFRRGRLELKSVRQALGCSHEWRPPKRAPIDVA
jgi:predicted PurR-regulated permease PerM